MSIHLRNRIRTVTHRYEWGKVHLNLSSVPSSIQLSSVDAIISSKQEPRIEEEM